MSVIGSLSPGDPEQVFMVPQGLEEGGSSEMSQWVV